MPILGIDNGLNGGWCLLSDCAGVSPIFKGAMPTRKIAGRAKDGKAEKREVDPDGIVGILELHTGPKDDLIVVIEEPLCGSFKIEISSIISLNRSFARIEAICLVKGFRVETVTPQQWQKRMLGKVPKGETKQYALEAAMRIWKGEDWTARKRCTVAHDGIVDAALIGEDRRRALP